MSGQRELGRRGHLGYGLGNLGLGLCEYTLQFTVVALYSHVAGLKPGTITMVLVATWCLSAIACPFVGAGWDARAEQEQAYRPRVWTAIALTCAGYYFVLHPPAEGPRLATLAWLFCGVLLTRGGMILFRVPYLALGANLSSDYHERTQVAGVRAAFGAAGQLVGLIVAQAIFLRADLEQPIGMLKVQGYAALGVAGALVIASGHALHATLSPRVFIDDARTLASATWRSHARGLSALSSMRLSQVVLGCAFVVAVWHGMTVALCGVSYGDLFVANTAIITTAPLLLGTLVGSLLVARVKVDRRIAYVTGAAMFAIVGLLPIVTRLLYVPEANNNSLHTGASIISPFVASIFGAVCPIALEAMLADIADVARLRTGLRSEGKVFGMAVALQSLGQAGGHFIDHHAIKLTLGTVGRGSEEADPWLALKFSVVMLPIAALALLSAFVLAQWQPAGVASQQAVKDMLRRRGVIDAQ